MIDFNSLYFEYNFSEIEEKYNIYFDDKKLLVKAFVHPSYSFENNENYQRLEFLGDSVLQMAVSDYLYRTLPDKKEGDMSKLRAKMVSEYSLALTIRNEGLDKYILVGKSVLNDSLEFSDSFVSDVFESFMAAIYLDKGFLYAEQMIHKLIIDNKDYILTLEQTVDYKTRLQEELQVNGTIKISYITEKEEENFCAKVYLEDLEIGQGFGKSKKQAEQQAAKNAIENKVY